MGEVIRHRVERALDARGVAQPAQGAQLARGEPGDAIGPGGGHAGAETPPYQSSRDSSTTPRRRFCQRRSRTTWWKNQSEA